MYRIPNIPGNHVAKKIDSYQVDCYITGADYSSQLSLLILTGYSKKESVIWKFQGLPLANIFQGVATKYSLKSLGKIQNEGITIVKENEIFLSSEGSFSPPMLYQIKLH